jgi:hypothetical protein
MSQGVEKQHTHCAIVKIPPQGIKPTGIGEVTHCVNKPEEEDV